MEILVLSFGIAKEITGNASDVYSVPYNSTVGDLRKMITDKYPQMLQLKSLAIAVNGSYVNDNTALNANDEIALLPPVSGG